jgi:hypothetical protein
MRFSSQFSVYVSYFIVILFSTSRCYYHKSSRFSYRYIIHPRNLAILDDSLDVSPNRDGGVMKKVLRRGNGINGYPVSKDTVAVAWKFFLSNGSLAHSSDELEEEFDFVIHAEPRHVIQAWEHAAKTMFEGEIAQLVIQPEYAFGARGVPPIIPPNAVLTCEFELIRITPSIKRQYQTIGYNESIRDELIDKLEAGDSPLTYNIMENKPIAEVKSDKQRKFFDPTKHKVDPRLRVTGEGDKWIWDECATVIEIQLRLPMNVNRKDDLSIDLRANDVKIFIKSTNEVLMEGPWQGKINPEESSWAIVEEEYSSWYRGPRLVLNLQKAYNEQDIWANIIRQPDQNSSTSVASNADESSIS